MSSIPTTYTINGDSTVTLQGSAALPVDMVMTVEGSTTNPVTTLMLGDPTKPLTTLVEGNPAKPVTTLMIGDPKQPITTLIEGSKDHPLALYIEHIPRIELSAEIGIKPTRIHNPMYLNFCLSLLGLEILKFAICGESMTIIEPYHPLKTERCA